MMNTLAILFSMIKADFLERTRRYSFLVTICLILYLGYAVNAGQVLIELGSYRGIYNSAWVGSLMALAITFLLGLNGFFLVKNTIDRDERTRVGQIFATTPLTRPQYLLAKWLSNFLVLASMVFILALAAILMQLIQREDPQVQIWPLIAPFLFIALPMIALVAAFAIFFETVHWLKGGLGNLVYFFLFMFLFVAGVKFPQRPWMDVTGFNLVGSSMKAAARAAFSNYDGTFVFAMVGREPLDTFIWPGLNWTVGLIFQRLSWVVVSLGIALLGSVFFDRFDPDSRSIGRPDRKSSPAEYARLDDKAASSAGSLKVTQLTPLAAGAHFRFNIFRLAWLEILLLVRGLKWYWLAGMAILWIGCVAWPGESLRKYWFMLVAIWPVLVWSKMGEREVRYQAEQLVFQAAYPLARLFAPSWLAGVMVTALATSGVLLGRMIFSEPVAPLSWVLSVFFIPTLALTLGAWSRSSKLFEVVYPILWYLGPLNPQNQLASLDYLGIHSQAMVNTSPIMFAGVILLLLLLGFIGRRQQANAYA